MLSVWRLADRRKFEYRHVIRNACGFSVYGIRGTCNHFGDYTCRNCNILDSFKYNGINNNESCGQIVSAGFFCLWTYILLT